MDCLMRLNWPDVSKRQGLLFGYPVDRAELFLQYFSVDPDSYGRRYVDPDLHGRRYARLWSCPDTTVAKELPLLWDMDEMPPTHVKAIISQYEYDVRLGIPTAMARTTETSFAAVLLWNGQRCLMPTSLVYQVIAGMAARYTNWEPRVLDTWDENGKPVWRILQGSIGDH